MKTESSIPLREAVSILMPVCNERDVIENVIREWERDVIRLLPAGSQLVLDDCSDDGTYEILHKLQEEFSWIRIIRSKKEGFFKAAKRLYESADTPWVFFTDSDGQYIPSEFWKLTPYAETHQMVHGAKQGRKDPFYRLAASGAFNFIVRSQFATKHKDVNSAFRLVRKEMVNQLVPKVSKMKTLFNAELLLRAETEGFKIASLPVQHREREFGKSRGLPLRGFIRECTAAYQGLRDLRREYESAPAGSLKTAAAEA